MTDLTFKTFVLLGNPQNRSIESGRAETPYHYCRVITASIQFMGTRRIVSVNYLFGRLLIPHDFLKGIFTSNIRDMGNLRPCVFGLIQMSFLVPKKGQVKFSERKYALRFSGNGQKCPSNLIRKDSSSSRMTEQIKIL